MARAQQVADTLGWPVTLRNVAMSMFDGRPACACYLPSGYLYRWRNVLREQDIPVRELDIRPTDRYLMERFVTGSANLIPERSEQQDGWRDVYLSALKSGSYQPALRCLSVDIETSYPRTGEPDRLFSIGFFARDFERVIMIGEGGNTASLEYVRDEPALLQRFLDVINDYDPDAILGWNFIQFDMAFLRRKFDEHQLPFRLGRDQSVVEWREVSDRLYVHVAGRVVLDGIECLRNATWQFESFALDDVARDLLGEGKLLKGDERGRDIERLFDEDKPALARYNLKDCELVLDIFDKTDLLNFLIARSRMTGLLPDRMGGSVAAFEFMYLPRLHRAGWVAPDIGDGYSAEKSPGGFVMDSRPGLYNNVLVLDFKSLYPSIIRTFRIDPQGLVEGMAADVDDTVPGYFGGRFHRQKHILPDLIRHLGEQREAARSKGNKPLSQAIKIIMASCYGVLGSEGCRFYDTRLSASITKRGHDIILRTSEWIRQQGYDVIYGDTDSVFVWLRDNLDDESADETGRNLARDLNRWWQDELKADFGLESYLELEYETHYRQFFMPSIRGEETGSKKRYAGIIASDSQLVFKGLEAVRSDWTKLARRFQKELYRRVFYGEPYQLWLKAEVDALLAGERDDELTYRKRLKRPLPMYQRSRPPHAKAAAKMDDWLRHHGRPEKYQERGGWISYMLTVNGPEPVEIRQSAIDYNHYLEKQLQPVAEAIFQFTGDDFAAIAGIQHTLF
jgi:DNA polymerase-2